MTIPMRTQAEEITTVREALSLLKTLKPKVDWTVNEATIRMARRELALAKDKARVKRGGGAAVYLPRVKDALPRRVQAAVSTLESSLPEAAAPVKKPAPKKPTPKKVVKKASPVRKEPAATPTTAVGPASELVESF